MKLYATKVTHMVGESKETNTFLVKCETYGRAEEIAYKTAEEFGYKDFSLESVVKKNIKEVHASINDECRMYLVNYEFGLESKPEKSNILISDNGLDIVHALTDALNFLYPLCNGLFIKDIKIQDFDVYVVDESSEETNEELAEEFAL